MFLCYFSTCSLHLPFHARKTYSALLELITADIINSSRHQEESPRRSREGFGVNSAYRGGGGQGGVRRLLPVWTDLQRHVHELWVRRSRQQRPGLLLVQPRESSLLLFFFLLLLLIRVCSLFNIPMPHLSPYLSAFLSNPPVLSFCYLSGTEKLLRRSRLFTRESTTWSS